jgi:hypothetical protein
MSDTPETPAGNAPPTGPTEPTGQTAFKAGLPPPPPISAPTAYRPVSGFAIAGLLLSCVFALMVLIVAAVALLKGEPFFYPAWVLLVPAAGLVISLVARSQVRGAEGTRAGEGLARAGIWIAVFTGLGYLVYDRVTGLAVTSQSNAFLMDLGPESGFFPHLLKGNQSTTDLYAAFLLSLPPTQRGSVKPENHQGIVHLHEDASDGGPGPLANFRNNVLIRLITSAPKDSVKIEPQGVDSWQYESRSYVVKRIYRLTTPEAQLDLSVLTLSAEGETAGEARKWFIALNRVGPPSEKRIKRTPLGEALRVMRFKARDAAYRWHEQVNEGKPVKFDTIDKTVWEKIRLPEQQRWYVKKRLEDMFRAKEKGRLTTLQFQPDNPLNLGDWQLTDDSKVQIDIPFKLKLEPQGDAPPFTADGRVIMESVVPIDPQAPPAAPEDVTWTVRGLEVAKASSPANLPTAKKEGPGPAPKGAAN